MIWLSIIGSPGPILTGIVESAYPPEVFVNRKFLCTQRNDDVQDTKLNFKSFRVKLSRNANDQIPRKFSKVFVEQKKPTRIFQDGNMLFRNMLFLP